MIKYKKGDDFMYDLIVVGGGFSGVGAAVAASRCGLKVLLLEKSGYLGGAACNSYVNPFSPYNTKVKGETRRISAGVFAEVIDELVKMDGLGENKATFNDEYLKLILDRLIQKENIDVLFHALVSEVIMDGNNIVGVKVPYKSQQLTFNARFFIDCTGDANIATMAKCPFFLGREKDNLCQPMTLCFRIANVDRDLFNIEREKIQALYKEYKEQGKIKNPRENVLVFTHMSEGVLHFNTTRVIMKNPTDIFDVSAAEMEAREQMYEVFVFLKENFESCKSATLIASAPEIGIRESRKICGEYVINEEDLKSLRVFDDRIAISRYDIDIHDPAGSGTSHYYFNEGEYYTIPYRTLVPKGVDNLLVAGRCISATHEAQASLRIMPVCCTLGEAAGVATAVASKNNTDKMKNVDIAKVQEILRANGAILD